jgi:hypothetical protein
VSQLLEQCCVQRIDGFWSLGWSLGGVGVCSHNARLYKRMNGGPTNGLASVGRAERGGGGCGRPLVEVVLPANPASVDVLLVLAVTAHALEVAAVATGIGVHETVLARMSVVACFD